MGSGDKDTVAAQPPPPAPKDIFDSFASNARDRENFRLLAAQGMKSNFLTGLRGVEGGPQVGGTPLPSIAPPAPPPVMQPTFPIPPTPADIRELKQGTPSNPGNLPYQVRPTIAKKVY